MFGLRVAGTAAIVVTCVVRGSMQDSPSVWNGVYTDAQAARGQAVYINHCSRCHGDDLTANPNYPLAGERFMDHWEAHTLQHLFRRIRDSMPPNDPVSLSESDKRDAMAYILQQNGFPAGSGELAQNDDELAAIQIVRKTGPGLLKTGALVRVAGCLAQRGREWELTGATDPERTTLDAAREKTNAIARGTRTVRVVNAFPSPAAHVGHLMQAIGFLVRDASGDAVNVLSLEPLAPNCAR